MRVASGVMLMVFLLSCAVQINDPDSALWIFYYGVATVFSALGVARIYLPWAGVAAVGFYIGFAMYLPGWSIDTLKLLREPKMSSHDVELAREAIGLLICAVWMTVLAWMWWRTRNGKNAAPDASHGAEDAGPVSDEAAS